MVSIAAFQAVGGGSNPLIRLKSIKVVYAGSTYKKLRAYEKSREAFRNLIDFIKKLLYNIYIRYEKEKRYDTSNNRTVNFRG